MSDDLKRRGPEDPKKVNVNQPWELDYWSKKFGVTKQRLKNAVAAVGTSVEKVEAYLRK